MDYVRVIVDTSAYAVLPLLMIAFLAKDGISVCAPLQGPAHDPWLLSRGSVAGRDRRSVWSQSNKWNLIPADMALAVFEYSTHKTVALHRSDLVPNLIDHAAGWALMASASDFDPQRFCKESNFCIVYFYILLGTFSLDWSAVQARFETRNYSCTSFIFGNDVCL